MGNEDVFKDIRDVDRWCAMDEHRQRAKAILNYNRKKLYKLPKKFNHLQEALTPAVMSFLLDIIAFWLKVDCLAYGKHEIVYFLGTHTGTYKVRRRTTKGVTNRYLNYLCAIGLLQKIKQIIPEGYDQKERRFFRKDCTARVNINLMKYDRNYKKEPFNTFELVPYTTELLQNCNENAKRLQDARITPGNISYNNLCVNGLEDIAKRVYLKNRELSVEKKNREYQYLVACIDALIEVNGYTTKEEVSAHMLLSDNEIKKLFVIFKNDWQKLYQYKAPNKEEKELYQIDGSSWIITKLD